MLLVRLKKKKGEEAEKISQIVCWIAQALKLKHIQVLSF